MSYASPLVKLLILQDSTSGGASIPLGQRTDCLNAGLEMASLNMGTMFRIAGQYANTPFSNSPTDIVAWATRMKELGTKPEMEIHSHAMCRAVAMTRVMVRLCDRD